MQSIAEVWKDIQGYEGLYQVSNFGRVKSLGRFVINPLVPKGYSWHPESILKQYKLSCGYLNVILCKNGKGTLLKVHRLVAIAFIPNPKNKPHIDHINTIKTDNNINNLRWVTAKENLKNTITIEHLKARRATEETKIKISNALSGKNNPRARKVRNLETNEIFYTINSAGQKYGVKSSSIRDAIRRNHKSAGYHWEYV